MKQLRIVVFTFTALLAFSAGLTACGGSTGLDRASSAALDSPQPIGTFEGSPAAPGDVLRMVLMADGTAHLELLSLCPSGLLSCAPAVIDGLYLSSETPGAQRLSFLGDQGQVLFGCDYRYDGSKTLEITRDGNKGQQTLAKAAAWCAAASQCEQQWIPEPLCISEWECVSNLCQSQCKGIGSGPEP